MRIEGTIWHYYLAILHSRNLIPYLYTYIFDLQVKEAEKQAMIEGIRENGSEAAEFVIRKVRISQNGTFM